MPSTSRTRSRRTAERRRTFRRVGKRTALEKVSPLGHLVELTEIDYNRLIGGRTFRVPCNLIRNGISLQISTLPDSGAHGVAFLNTKIAIRAGQLLGVNPLPLTSLIFLKGYNGVTSNSITYYIIFNIKINGY